MTQESKTETRNREATTQRRIWRGVVYGVLAFAFALVSLGSLVADGLEEGGGTPLLYVVTFLPAFWLARLSYRHLKRRYTSELSDEELGDEAPVLFLRPFDEDAGWDGAVAFNTFNPRTWRKFPLSPMNMLTLYLEMTGRASFEQVLAHVTRKTGPLVAIGEPGNPPILGARNVYIGDDNWQQEVIDLAGRSRLVVLTTGTTEGVLWETQRMVEAVAPERLLLAIPGASRRARNQAYESFCEAAAGYFPSGLPDTISGARFISFQGGWQPALTPGFFDQPEKNTPPWVAKRLTKILV